MPEGKILEHQVAAPSEGCAGCASEKEEPSEHAPEYQPLATWPPARVFGSTFAALQPRANAIAERLVRSIRQECLDHLIIINERHLSMVLVEFADYYNLH
jgi:hypothetical protein